jgi:para-aminobenzoate synthetase component 2
MKRALFLDFEDSFTYNLIQEVEEIGISVQVINWEKFTGQEKADLLILGPGPGHPDDYSAIFDKIETWLGDGKKIFAICLGHQIVWKLKDFEIIPSVRPIHGQSVELPISQDVENWINLKGPLKVQRYNSLAVKYSRFMDLELQIIDGDELMLAKSSQIISYQFHPESVGTKCRKSFFIPILKDLL